MCSWNAVGTNSIDHFIAVVYISHNVFVLTSVSICDNDNKRKSGEKN